MEPLRVEVFQKGASDCGAVAFLAPSGSGPSAPFELASFFPARRPGLLPWGLHASGPGMGEISLVPWPARVRPRFSRTVWAEPRACGTLTPGASAPPVAAPRRAQTNIHSRLCVITPFHTQLERRPLLMKSLLVEMFQKGANGSGAVAFGAPSGSGHGHLRPPSPV